MCNCFAAILRGRIISEVSTKALRLPFRHHIISSRGSINSYPSRTSSLPPWFVVQGCQLSRGLVGIDIRPPTIRSADGAHSQRSSQSDRGWAR
jgi:hypothetical protein